MHNTHYKIHNTQWTIHNTIIWASFGQHLDIVWPSFGHRLAIIRTSYEHHLDIIWLSFRHHLDTCSGLQFVTKTPNLDFAIKHSAQAFPESATESKINLSPFETRLEQQIKCPATLYFSKIKSLAISCACACPDCLYESVSGHLLRTGELGNLLSPSKSSS